MKAIEASRVFRTLASVPSQAARPIASRIHKAIQKQFDEGRDPFGRDWAPLAPATLAKGRRPPPLTDTRRGRNSISVRPTRGAGIAILVGVFYMAIHNKGNLPRLPRRLILPTNVLPKEWNKIYKEELEAALARRLGKI